MTHDRQIIISVGNNRRDLAWKQTAMSVSDLYARLGNPIRSTETLADYMRLKKAQQDDLKDVGGFVGGSMSGPRRKAINVTGRDLITLDFDNIPGWQTPLIVQKCEELGCGYCIYSTRKHDPSAPRLRVVIPTDRTMTPDEYEPCARRVAAQIGIGMADPTTFEVSRLMYWPSCCVDSEFVHQTKDAPLLSVDFILSTYADWRNFMSWPQVPGATSYQKLAVKAGDPLEKQGIVGVFCRTYDVVAAMERYLPGIYAPVEGDENRYTYLGGSTTGGAIIYDDAKFLFSHHATDPCGGRLVNAFDLIRLHRFGDQDDNAAPDTPVSKLPSYKAMCDAALADAAVCTTLNNEQHAQALKDFEDFAAPEIPDTDESAWTMELKRNQNGQIKATIDNILLILDHDLNLCGKFALNKFAGRGEVLAATPWDRHWKRRRLWSDTDTNGLYWYMEKYWGINSNGKVDSALDLHAAIHAFNEVQDYISGLVWDGTPRLDTLFIDYLGAKDTAYNRAVCRKSFTAAVARAMEPGCKFDNMLILTGPQGIGKSTLLDRMSKGWFNDSIRTFEGKDASELLQGVWLVEVSELDAFRKSDVSRIKQFLSLRADRYRAAYGRHVKELPRCCVFFGTTNTTEFLQDTTGNRRFWPVDVGEQPHDKTVWQDLTDTEIDQIWAEAKTRWQIGEPLYLAGEVAVAAQEKQEEHRESSVREGLIREFVEKQIPDDWSKWNIDRRRDFWAGQLHAADGQTVHLVERDRISAIEVWCELLGGSVRDMKNTDAREINAILSAIDGWKRSPKVIRVGPYNVQRGFVRKA